MIKPQPRIVFLGTPDFAVPALEKLVETNYSPVLVITQPDRPVGRGKILTPPPVKTVALKYGLPVAQPETKKDLAKIFSELECDLAILVAYGQIIPDEVLAKPRLGFVNLHPSKLPRYRGPSPIQAALLAGDAETAVTVIKLTKELDAGPIIAQQLVTIAIQDTYESLVVRLANQGAETLVNCLPGYLTETTELANQDEAGVSYCKMITRQDGQVDWSKSAKVIYRQFRAFYPWPGLFTYINKKRLKIVNLEVLEGSLEAGMASGALFLSPTGQLAVTCGQGAVILNTIQLEGKNPMPGQVFIGNQKELLGQVVG